jgi:two-component sensor histidine kinase
VFWREQAERMVRGDDPHPIVAYTLAIFTTFLACAIHWIIPALGSGIVPFATFYASALLSGLFGGYRAGLAAIALGAVIGEWAFVAEDFSIASASGLDIGRMLAFVLVSLLIVWGANYYRGLASRLRQEQAHRKLVIGELTHRLKNKIATVHAVLQQVLRAHPEIFDTVDKRLRLLAATDDLLLDADSKGCALQDVFNAELAPYSMSRIEMSGPPVHLPGKLAVTLALIVHELATNAAKYGALSATSGNVAVAWKVDGNNLTVDWKETGGPSVKLPTRRGFGTHLVVRALATFGGDATADFNPAGLVCQMRCVVPQDSDRLV